MSERQSLAEQHEHGEFQEEVQKLVDGIVAEIRAKNLTTKKIVTYELLINTSLSSYTNDSDLALVALRSTQNTAALAVVRNLALGAMWQAVQTELQTREEFQKL